jgi:hypothetical protein
MLTSIPSPAQDISMALALCALVQHFAAHYPSDDKILYSHCFPVMLYQALLFI